jgi:hypothetical protein
MVEGDLKPSSASARQKDVFVGQRRLQQGLPESALSPRTSSNASIGDVIPASGDKESGAVKSGDEVSESQSDRVSAASRCYPRT